jgi:hypothetical protein
MTYRKTSASIVEDVQCQESVKPMLQIRDVSAFCRRYSNGRREERGMPAYGGRFNERCSLGMQLAVDCEKTSPGNGRGSMPEKGTIARARRDKRAGKSASTQAGEYVREEMEHVREGRHGARSPKQAIAIGLSKARRAGVKLAPPKRGQASERTRRSAERALRHPRTKPSRRRSRAVHSA